MTIDPGIAKNAATLRELIDEVAQQGKGMMAQLTVQARQAQTAAAASATTTIAIGTSSFLFMSAGFQNRLRHDAPCPDRGLRRRQ